MVKHLPPLLQTAAKCDSTNGISPESLQVKQNFIMFSQYIYFEL